MPSSQLPRQRRRWQLRGTGGGTGGQRPRRRRRSQRHHRRGRFTTLPFIDQLLVEPLDIRDGQLQLSGAPGLGIELNFEVVDRYRMADPLDLPLGCYSDMMFGKEHFPQPFEYVEDRG